MADEEKNETTEETTDEPVADEPAAEADAPVEEAAAEEPEPYLRPSGDPAPFRAGRCAASPVRSGP